MVNRYANGPEELDENGQGPYVLATDYEKLEAENATATHQIESLANQCQFQAERLVALDAENAELRKQCAAFHAEANDHYRASLAANATLDRLREVVPYTFTTENSHIWRKSLYKVKSILYPTPETPND